MSQYAEYGVIFNWGLLRLVRATQVALCTSVVDLTGSVVDLPSFVPLDPGGLYYNHMPAIVPNCLVRLAQPAGAESVVE